MKRNVILIVATILIATGFTVGFGITYLGPRIAESATNHWFGLFVKDSIGSPVQNIAVRLPSYGSYAYTTDVNGYTGKMWTTGLSNGCPAGLSGVEIPATVFYQNTEYAVYLKADANVTLTL